MRSRASGGSAVVSASAANGSTGNDSSVTAGKRSSSSTSQPLRPSHHAAEQHTVSKPLAVSAAMRSGDSPGVHATQRNADPSLAVSVVNAAHEAIGRRSASRQTNPVTPAATASPRRTRHASSSMRSTGPSRTARGGRRGSSAASPSTSHGASGGLAFASNRGCPERSGATASQTPSDRARQASTSAASGRTPSDAAPERSASRISSVSNPCSATRSRTVPAGPPPSVADHSFQAISAIRDCKRGILSGMPGRGRRRSARRWSSLEPRRRGAVIGVRRSCGIAADTPSAVVDRSIRDGRSGRRPCLCAREAMVILAPRISTFPNRAPRVLSAKRGPGSEATGRFAGPVSQQSSASATSLAA